MKKVSLLVLICMILSLVCTTLVACGGEEEHTHEYSDAWTMDGTNHFHLCACGAKSGTAAHADANNDGACDACKVIMAHSHFFSPEWTVDGTNHWHAALCGHTVPALDTAAHTPDELGECTVCGYKAPGVTPDVTTVEKAIAVATAMQKHVIGGTYTPANTYASEVTFDAVKGYLHTCVVVDNIHHFIHDNNNGTATKVMIWGDDQTVDKAADAKCLNGIEINLSEVIGADQTVYGLIELLNFFYTEFPAIGENVEVMTEVRDGYFTFGYADPTGAGTYNVSVSFWLDATYYYVNKLSIVIYTDKYYETYEDSEIQYITFAQHGTPAPDYLPEDVIATGVEFKNAANETITFTNKVAAAIETGVGNYVINLNALGSDQVIFDTLGDITCVIKDAEGNEVDTSKASSFYWDQALTVYLKDEGTFYANITIGEDTYVIPFVAAYAAPTEITALYWIEDGMWNSRMEPVTGNVNAATGMDTILTAELPSGCNPDAFTATIVGDTTDATITENIFDDGWGNEYKAFYFNATVAGTYTVKIASTVDETISATVTLVVTAPPSVEGNATGKWEGGSVMGSYSVNFYPTDETKGVVVVAASARGNSETAIFTYYIEDGEFVAEPVSDEYMMISGIEVAISGVTVNAMVSLTRSATEADAWDTETLGEMPVAPGYVEQEPSNELVAGSGANSATKIVIEATGTYTYTTTIAANSVGYFKIFNPAETSTTWNENWVITATWNNESITFYSAALSNSDFGNGAWTGVDFYLQNGTGSDITIEFTLTVATAE